MIVSGSDDSDTDSNITSVFPRWLVIEAANSDLSLSYLSPFALGKALQAQIGTLRLVKRQGVTFSWRRTNIATVECCLG